MTPLCRPVRTAYGAIPCMLAASLSACAQEDPQTYVYDTVLPFRFTPAAEAITNRSTWVRLSENERRHAFRGDALLVNNRLAILLRRGASGVDMYSVEPASLRRLGTLTPAVSAPRIASFAITENTPAGVQGDITFEGSVAFSCRLVPGDAIVELHAIQETQEIRIESDLRYVVIPNYFGNDMVFGPASLDEDAFDLAAEQMALGLLDNGAAVLMVTAESASQRFRLLQHRSESSRRLSALGVDVRANGKAWLAFLLGKGIWGVFPSQAGTTAWSPPFPARWRMNALGSRGMARSSSWPDRRLESSATGIVYPLERDAATPLSCLCVRDIMKNTLGVGPCEYLISVEVLNDATPHAVAGWLRALLEKKKAQHAADQIRERLTHMQDHVAHAQDRIRGYLALSRRLQEMAQTSSDTEGARMLEELAGPFERAAADFHAAGDVVASTRDIAEAYLRHIGKPDARGVLAEQEDNLRRIGHFLDRTLADCRLAAQWTRLRLLRLASCHSELKKKVEILVHDIDLLLKKG